MSQQRFTFVLVKSGQPGPWIRRNGRPPAAVPAVPAVPEDTFAPDIPDVEEAPAMAPVPPTQDMDMDIEYSGQYNPNAPAPETETETEGDLYGSYSDTESADMSDDSSVQQPVSQIQPDTESADLTMPATEVVMPDQIPDTEVVNADTVADESDGEVTQAVKALAITDDADEAPPVEFGIPLTHLLPPPVSLDVALASLHWVLSTPLPVLQLPASDASAMMMNGAPDGGDDDGGDDDGPESEPEPEPDDEPVNDATAEWSDGANDSDYVPESEPESEPMSDDEGDELPVPAKRKYTRPSEKSLRFASDRIITGTEYEQVMKKLCSARGARFFE